MGKIKSTVNSAQVFCSLFSATREVIMKSIIGMLVVLVLAGFSLTHLGSGDAAGHPQKEDPTPVQLGVMTDTQKAHSRLYGKYRRDKKIIDLLQREEGDIDLFRLAGLLAELGSAPLPSPQELLRRFTCSADVVVLGVPKRKTSQITESEDFLFTDYEVEVHQVLKNTGNQVIQEYSEITITRPGGVIVVNGRKVRALDETIPLLRLGKSYIFFLNSIPQTGAYQAVEGGVSYSVKGKRLQKFSQDTEDRLTRYYTAASFLNEIRIVATQGCDGQTGGVR
jgi:hypothetical protein